MNHCEIQAYIDAQLANVKLLGTQAEMNTGRLELADGNNVPFNSIVANQNPSVSLDATTGVFTVLKGGNYTVQYSVTVNGSGADNKVILDCNGIKSESFAETEGQSCGYAVLNLKPGDTISVKNVSGQVIVLFGSQVQASIMISTI